MLQARSQIGEGLAKLKRTVVASIFSTLFTLV
jgi:hypothetical protein